MSTTLDLKILPKVLAVINKFGTTAVFANITSTGPVIADGSVTRGTENESVKVSPPDRYENRYVDGDSILEDDLRIIVPASGLDWAPGVSEKVTVVGQEFEIVSVKPIYSGDDIAVWEVQLRG